MAKLTQAQRAFLISHHIPPSVVFDATGLSKSKYSPLMKELEKSFAYGVTPCRAAGHTLRSRAGHCIQCGTANIAFQMNYNKGAIIYIAGSFSSRLIKIGITNDVQQRLSLLKHYSYGRADDWEILLWARVPNAGRIEADAHGALSGFSIEGTYLREGRETECYELFRCSYKVARDALTKLLPPSTKINADREERSMQVYDF
jgi:hypothetical protein